MSSPVLAALEEAFDQVTCHCPSTLFYESKLLKRDLAISCVLQVVVVEPLDSKDLAHLTLLDRTELGITFTKVQSNLQKGVYCSIFTWFNF